MAAGPAAYGLEHQARCIAPFYQTSRPEGVHRFLVGTSNFSGDNKIYLVDYHEATRVADCTAVWSHDAEIWGLSVSPSTTSGQCMFATYTPGDDQCRLHRVVETPSGDLNALESLNAFPVGVRQVLWDTEGLQSEVRSVGARDVSLWKLDSFVGSASAASGASAATRITLPNSSPVIERAAVDPHRADVVGVATAESIWMVDTRNKRAASTPVHSPHLGGIRWLDFSSASINKLLTTGNDGRVLIWDTRQLSNPTASSGGPARPEVLIRGHQHHCLGAAFHPYHDQLVLSWGSDHACRLWDMKAPLSSTTSSDPQRRHAAAALSALGNKSTHCEKTLSEFGESVYSAAWSHSGAWVFAAVSFHGKVLVDAVSQECKMRILMSAHHSEDTSPAA